MVGKLPEAALGECSLHSDVLGEIRHWWGTLDVILLASRFVAQDMESLPNDQFHLLQLLHRLKVERVLVILITPNWPRRSWFSTVIHLLAEPFLVSFRPTRSLSQGPIVLSALWSLAFMAGLLKPKS